MCRHNLASLMLFALVSGCSTSRNPSTQVSALRLSAASTPSITGTDIDVTLLPTAYDAVMRLRPELLRRTGHDLLKSTPVVYLDGVYQGSVAVLQTIPSEAILDIRYVAPVSADFEFMRYHPGGVIAVRTR